jgi:hypothetical protein
VLFQTKQDASQSKLTTMFNASRPTQGPASSFSIRSCVEKNIYVVQGFTLLSVIEIRFQVAKPIGGGELLLSVPRSTTLSCKRVNFIHS